MDDAKLDMGLWVDAVYRIPEALQNINAGSQDVLKTTIFQLRQHIHSELCALIFGQPYAQQLVLAFGIDPQSHENSFVYHTAILADF